MTLDDSQIDRYSRQIILPEIGGRGQEVLLQSSVAVVGSGNLAEITVLYLAAAGVGGLDLYRASGEPAQAATHLNEEVARLNPDVRVQTALLPDRDSGSTHWARSYGVIAITNTDPVILDQVNWTTMTEDRPLVTGAVARGHGWLCVIARPGPCARCVGLSALSRTDDRVATPLQPVVAGVIGSLQALEVLKLLLGLESMPPGIRLHYDGEQSSLEQESIAKQPNCPICG